MNLILRDLVMKNEFNIISLLKKIEEANNLGITRLVIAPAYFDEESKSSISEVKNIVDDLNKYLYENKIDLKLYSASLLRDNFDNIKDFLDGKLGTINESNYILLKVEESNSLNELLEIIYELTLREYVPIIVAPEKIPQIRDNYKNINKLLDEKCLFQLDINSFNGADGKKVLKTAKILKKKDIYSFIGYEEVTKKENIIKDIENISKKSLYILNKSSELNKITKSKKEKEKQLS
ncbi:CpsB/CapC family capsule biosynthesis tyrosine phosphatase [Clostridium tertium]